MAGGFCGVEGTVVTKSLLLQKYYYQVPLSTNATTVVLLSQYVLVLGQGPVL